MQDLDTILPAQVKGKLSLDRVTFLLFSPRLSAWSKEKQEIRECERRIQKMAEMVSNLLEPVLDADFPQGYPSELFLHHFRTTDGIDIQFGAVMPKRKKVTDSDIILKYGSAEDKEKGYMFDYSPNTYAFRVEFNPNNSSLDSVKPILEVFKHYQSDASSLVRLARLDIAIDYDTDIYPGLVMCHGMRKGFLAYGQKGIESVYWGSRQSKYMFRLYDKRQEQLDKENVDLGFSRWRLELESKDSFFLTGEKPNFEKVFDRVSFSDGATSSGDWQIDLVRRLAVQDGLDSVLREMPKNTAYRYRKFFRDSSYRHLEKPSAVFNREFELCFNRLRSSILSAMGYKVE